MELLVRYNDPGTPHLTVVLYIIIKLRCVVYLLSFYCLHVFFFSLALPQVSFPDQTPYFIGRNLQSAAHPVEMMKWSWSTMKVTFGRWTAFIFITGVPVLGSFDKTWNASPAHAFCDKCWGSAPRKRIWMLLVFVSSTFCYYKIQGRWLALTPVSRLLKKGEEVKDSCNPFFNTSSLSPSLLSSFSGSTGACQVIVELKYWCGVSKRGVALLCFQN